MWVPQVRGPHGLGAPATGPRRWGEGAGLRPWGGDPSHLGTWETTTLQPASCPTLDSPLHCGCPILSTVSPWNGWSTMKAGTTATPRRGGMRIAPGETRGKRPKRIPKRPVGSLRNSSPRLIESRTVPHPFHFFMRNGWDSTASISPNDYFIACFSNGSRNLAAPCPCQTTRPVASISTTHGSLSLSSPK